MVLNKLFLIFLFILLIFQSANAVDVDSQLDHRISLSGHISFYSTPKKLSALEALDSILSSDRVTHHSKNLSPGFSKDYYWIYIPINNKANHSATFVIELDNPHIDSIEFYEINSYSTPNLLAIAGDRMPFAKRPIQNRRFVCEINLPANSSKSFLLLVDKRNASVSFPLYLWAKERFYLVEQRAQLGYFLYFGGAIFIFLFTLVIGSITRNIRMLSYSFYIALMALYLFSALGFAFQYLYPFSDSINNFFRSQILVATIASFFLFSALFMKIHENLKAVFKLILWVVLFLLSLVVLSLVFNEFFFHHIIIFLNIIYLISLFSIPFLLYAAIKTYKYNSNLTISYIIAVSALFFGGLLNILVEYGLMSESILPINPVLLATIVELFVFSYAFILEIKIINDKKNSLLEAKAKLQKQLLTAYMKGTEEEGSRISKELHDNIGSRLAILKNQLELKGADKEKLKQQISELFSDVRTISDELSPNKIHFLGLKNSIIQLMERVEASSSININSYIDELPQLSDHVVLQIYRVMQEIMQNIIKHSKAQNVDCQLVMNEGVLNIIVDDDGVGFSMAELENYQGNGLNNMRLRIESIGGQLEISSQPGSGTHIVIWFEHFDLL